MTRLPRSLALVGLVALVAAGCGSDEGAKSAPGRDGELGTQAQLDEVTAKVDPLLAELETAFEEVDSAEEEPSEDELIERMRDALEDSKLVDEVTVEEEWSIDGPLPCGSTGDADQGLLASGEGFFVGVASEAFVAGFAEDGEGGDVGMVVARCTDGESGALLVAGPELDGEPASPNVSLLSFAPDGSPPKQLVRRLRKEMGRQEGPSSSATIVDWSYGTPVECPDGDEPVAIATPEDSPHYLRGYGTSEHVVAFAEQQTQELGVLGGACEDGEATLRLVALPIGEQLDE